MNQGRFRHVGSDRSLVSSEGNHKASCVPGTSRIQGRGSEFGSDLVL
jgi:hypothetical protein